MNSKCSMDISWSVGATLGSLGYAQAAKDKRVIACIGDGSFPGLAMVMHKKGEDGALFEMLHKALQLATREKRVTEERNIMILIAQMHVVKGHLDEALKTFEELVTDNPRHFRPYLCQVIFILTKSRKHCHALDDYFWLRHFSKSVTKIDTTS